MVGLAGPSPLLAADPTSVLDLPWLVRGPLAFAVVLVLGAAILWRYEAVVDRSIDASTDRPLSSMAYGVAAHGTIGFFGIYAASQLGQVSLSGRSLGVMGLWAGIVLLAVAAGLGFTVVGTAAVEFGWERRRWHGLLVGALVAGLAAVANPLVGGLIWLLVVSTGIGGPVRSWFHASEDVDG